MILPVISEFEYEELYDEVMWYRPLVTRDP